MSDPPMLFGKPIIFTDKIPQLSGPLILYAPMFPCEAFVKGWDWGKWRAMHEFFLNYQSN